VTRSRLQKDSRFIVQKTGEDGKQHYERNFNKTRWSEETSFYVSTLDMSPAEALVEIRKHWQIENNLHWFLDVTFREDSWTELFEHGRSHTLRQQNPLLTFHFAQTKR
jgi:predicted transposase YbfD/YdcC